MEYVTNLAKEDPSIATRSIHNLEFTYPVQYYDFHVYYVAHNKSSVKESTELIDKLLHDFPQECSNGSILIKKLYTDEHVIGPHITHFWEADVARPEVFIKVLSWFQLYHGNLSVLIHPQTGDDLKDHTASALWLGEKLPLITEYLPAAEGLVPEFGVKGGERIPVDKFKAHKTVI